MAIAYSGPSDDAFDFNDQGVQFIQHHRALYRALWAQSVAMDLVTPTMDWSEYALVYLPHFAVLDEVAITGDLVVAFRRHSRQGGSLIFALNVEQRTARTRSRAGR